MDTLRTFGGLSGFPKPGESICDAFTVGHASTSVSVAVGMARARTILHKDYRVVALLGDGALSGGLAYEGLSDAGDSGEPLIVILNDNGMSITQSVGGVADTFGPPAFEAPVPQFQKSLPPGDEFIFTGPPHLQGDPQDQDRRQGDAAAVQPL